MLKKKLFTHNFGLKFQELFTMFYNSRLNTFYNIVSSSTSHSAAKFHVGSLPRKHSQMSKGRRQPIHYFQFVHPVSTAIPNIPCAFHCIWHLKCFYLFFMNLLIYFHLICVSLYIYFPEKNRGLAIYIKFMSAYLLVNVVIIFIIYWMLTRRLTQDLETSSYENFNRIYTNTSFAYFLNK